MRYILSLVLTICLCGSALAGDNPFAQVIEDEEARIAAVLVDREKANAAAELLKGIYAGEYGDELVEAEDGLGGVVISDPASEGVYYVPDAERYEKALQKMEKDDSDHREFGNRLICVLFILLILVSAWSILCAPKGTEDRRTAARLALIVWAFAGTCVWGYAYFYCKDNMAKEQYSPRIIRAVLQNRPESVDAEFYSYSKGQIEKLITEYAARYDNNVLERRN